MFYLRLQFKAPLQSWGIKEDWYKTRRTHAVPTKTALTGLIGRAMGIWYEEKDRLETIAEDIKDVRVVTADDFPVRLTDDQVIYVQDYMDLGMAKSLPAAKGGVRSTKSGNTTSVQFTKDYLEDADIEVDLGGDKEFLEKVREALIHPVYPVYIGRYCCIPQECIVKDGKITESED